jgi:hypothetical protein
VRTKEERLDGIEISSGFCLAFAVNETSIGAKEQETVPDGGIPPIRQVVPRRSRRFRRTKRGNEPISALSGKRLLVLPSRSKKT